MVSGSDISGKSLDERGFGIGEMSVAQSGRRSICASQLVGFPLSIHDNAPVKSEVNPTCHNNRRQ
jgi:hypothetical protein